MKNILDILVVEDDEVDFLAIKRHLNWSNSTEFRLTRAAGYPEAMEAVEQKSFDCALVDYSLNGHSGFDLMAALGGQEAPFPVIILTGHTIGAIEALRPVDGAFDFLEKTALTQQLLQRTIFYAIEHYQIEASLRAARDRAENSAAVGRRLMMLVSREVAMPLQAVTDGCKESGAIQEQAETALRILKMLSDYMHLEEKTQELSLTECDVDALFAQAMTAAGGLPAGVEFSADMDGLARARMIGDPEKLQHVLSGIMSFLISRQQVSSVSVRAAMAEGGLKVEADILFRDEIPADILRASCFGSVDLFEQDDVTMPLLSAAIAHKLAGLMNGTCDMVTGEEASVRACLFVPSAAPVLKVQPGQAARTV